MSAPPPDPYLVAWSDLKRRRLWLLGSLVWLGVAIFLSRDARAHPWPVAPLVMALATFVLAVWCDRFRCPRCAQFFGRKGLRHNAFAPRCMHCGTEVGTLKSPAAAMRR